jgi:hypothetical protein
MSCNLSESNLFFTHEILSFPKNGSPRTINVGTPNTLSRSASFSAEKIFQMIHFHLMFHKEV